MSVEAIQYVEALAQTPACRSVSSSEWLVLRTLAFFWNPQVGCAFASVAKIATKSLLSERTVQRVIPKLEKRGLVVRHGSRYGDGSGPQTTNEYELPGMLSTAVGPEGRQQVFKASRTRVSTQLMLPGKKARGGRAGDVEGVVSDVVLSPLGVTTGDTLGGDNRCHPLEESLEENMKRNTHPLPFRDVADVEKSKGLPMKATASATATAEATATAKTEPDEAAADSDEGVAMPGVSSGAAVIEFPASARVRERRRAQLDGAEAALYGETTRVLVACGLSPEGSTRRQRAAVSDALRLAVETRGWTLAVAGQTAVQRWRQYSADTHLLRDPVGIRLFFVEAVWLNPEGWPYDRAALSRVRRL